MLINKVVQVVRFPKQKFGNGTYRADRTRDASNFEQCLNNTAHGDAADQGHKAVQDVNVHPGALNFDQRPGV